MWAHAIDNTSPSVSALHAPLNRLGDEGWELVSVHWCPGGHNGTAFLACDTQAPEVGLGTARVGRPYARGCSSCRCVLIVEIAESGVEAANAPCYTASVDLLSSERAGEYRGKTLHLLSARGHDGCQWTAL